MEGLISGGAYFRNYFTVFKISLTESQIFKKLQTLAYLSWRFQTLLWRPGETVQNHESPGISRRVESTVGAVV